MPRDIGRVQDPQCPYRLEADSHSRIGCQRWCAGVAQIAVVARVGRRERAVDRCLFGGCGCFAVTDDRERVDGRSRGERGSGSPHDGMQGAITATMLRTCLKPAPMLCSNPKANLAWI